ncbi:MAG: hypothetical protein ACOC0Z_07115, partial [Halohasta sp.]
ERTMRKKTRKRRMTGETTKRTERTMKLTEVFRSQGDDYDVTIHECRRCGTNLPADAIQCSRCSSREIAHYRW